MSKLSETDQVGIDLIEMRTRITMFVLWTHGHSVASIAARMKRRESDTKNWITAGCPLVHIGKSLEPADSVLVTSVTTPADEIMRR